MCEPEQGVPGAIRGVPGANGGWVFGSQRHVLLHLLQDHGPLPAGKGGTGRGVGEGVGGCKW